MIISHAVYYSRYGIVFVDHVELEGEIVAAWGVVDLLYDKPVMATNGKVFIGTKESMSNFAKELNLQSVMFGPDMTVQAIEKLKPK